MTPTSPRARARSDELAFVDRLMRLRRAMAAMAQELGTLKREHRRVLRENDDLRRQIVVLTRERDGAYAGR
jgi:regulator of replication initiation timing